MIHQPHYWKSITDVKQLLKISRSFYACASWNKQQAKTIDRLSGVYDMGLCYAERRKEYLDAAEMYRVEIMEIAEHVYVLKNKLKEETV